MTFKGCRSKITGANREECMKTGGMSRAREDARHWLPSQGVDPAPLAELNAECLGLLATRAAEHPGGLGVSLPPLLAALREPWAELSAQAVRRLAAAPFSLFDVGIAEAPRWLELRARAVHDSVLRTEAVFFEAAAARSISRRMLLYGWHLARSRPRAACLVFGCSIVAVESLAACSLAVLEAVAERGAERLKPRWATQLVIWRALLEAASAGADRRLHELLLGGIQRLAAETLAAHPP
jgi:hypothetical protein